MSEMSNDKALSTLNRIYDIALNGLHYQLHCQQILQVYYMCR